MVTVWIKVPFQYILNCVPVLSNFKVPVGVILAFETITLADILMKFKLILLYAIDISSNHNPLVQPVDWTVKSQSISAMYSDGRTTLFSVKLSVLVFPCTSNPLLLYVKLPLPVLKVCLFLLDVSVSYSVQS